MVVAALAVYNHGLPLAGAIREGFLCEHPITNGQGGYGSQQFGYDSVGNRLSLVNNSQTQNYQYPSTTHRLSSITGNQATSLTYDANGNTLTKSGMTFTYDARNRLVSAINGSNNASYNYLATGARSTKVLNGTTNIYHYDLNGKLIAETNATGQTLREYVYLDNQPLALINASNSAIYYYHTDQLSTPQKLTNQTQAIAWDASYEPFGKTNVAVQQVTQNLRFPGQYFDSETNLHYNHFRDYDPSIGRYIESDPIGLRGGVNTYGYALQNPGRYKDIFGLETYQCTRPLNVLPISIGLLHHQYICVGNEKEGYTCGGLGPTGDINGSPGQIEPDKYKPDNCKKTQDKDDCIESCIKKKLSEPPPYYDIRLNNGANCQTYAPNTETECVMICAMKKP
ncbi:MAG: RHS domain-containing protein [Gammaproteobacteria bacterium]|nr:RHS domain-containing protein [Gammaproteobacteria bacterium]